MISFIKIPPPSTGIQRHVK